MIINFAKYTNQNIKAAIERLPNVFDESDKYTLFRLVDSNDILAYIGLLYLHGALNVDLQNTRDLRLYESPNDLLAATMSWNRFYFISKFITFDNKATLSGDASKYYISGTDYYTKYLVNEVTRHNSIQGCNILKDRYFTFFTLAEWALDRNFTIAGTMRHDRKGIPKELKIMKNRDERPVLYVHHWEKIIMLVSHTDKKKSGNRNIIDLTTLHDTVKVSNNKRSKPQVLIKYNHTKGGIDIVDLLSTDHTIRIKWKRWLLDAFSFILDMVKTNSKTMLSDNKFKLSNFDFTSALGKALVLPNIQNRYQNENRIQLPILQKIKRVLGIKETNRRPQTEAPATLFGRCHVCFQEIVGTSQYKKMQQKMNNKIKSKCAHCSSFICKKHVVETKFICCDCADE